MALGANPDEGIAPPGEEPPSRLERPAVLGTAGLFAVVLALTVIAVPTHFAAQVGTTHLVEEFPTNAVISMTWHSSDGSPVTLSVHSIYQNVSLEDGIANENQVVYNQTGTSGTLVFVATGAQYSFVCGCGADVNSGTTIVLSGSVATPLV
ncbi:MAG TPA: hypothetical protein VFF67_02155 [Thermoplasmata archaeon]|nr:hypothetical protein [Thermoplasmata archaeon]